MAPDLNSLPELAESANTVVPAIMANHSDRPLNLEGPPSPSPRSTSLQAAATLNAGLQREQPSRRSSNSSISRSITSPVPPSPSAGRRRSQILMNLQIADPSIPGPGEMVSEHRNRSSSPHVSASPQPLYADPHHQRTPSLGELHQSLENEQEFQVNRLLSEIRRLQLQVQRQQSGPLSGSAIGDDSAPPSAIPTSGSLPRSPGFPIHPRSSFDMARADLSRRSRTPSRGASPRVRATSIGDSSEHMLLGGRDESAFYQAETQMLVRENQMLRHRIRELEKQLSEVSGTATNSSITHEPVQASHLHRSTSISEESTRQPDPSRQAELMSRPHPNTLTENPKRI